MTEDEVRAIAKDEAEKVIGSALAALTETLTVAAQERADRITSAYAAHLSDA